MRARLERVRSALAEVETAPRVFFCDLIAIGAWATKASSHIVSLHVEGATVWTGAVATGTPSSTGTMASGQSFAVYPVSATTAHTDKQLNVGISANISGFTAPAGDLQVDITGCASSLKFVYWELINDQTGAVAGSDVRCGSKLVPNLSAGQYRLIVSHNGVAGTYGLSAFSAPSPQTFNLTLPASVSSGEYSE